MTRKTTLYLIWSLAIVATLGSLYFSEVLKLPPCVLCWYQRIFIYPLVLLIPVGLLRKDEHNLPYYLLPLTILGGLIAVYHNLLYYQILPESAGPCSLGVSCTTKFFEWFGFISIPFLSLAAFAVISGLFLWLIRKERT